MSSTEPGLRERKKTSTRRALSDAALNLALTHGMDAVRREDIAEAAGVSPRTFTNYFSTKYEALAYRQVERMRRSVEVLRERPADEPLWDAITAAVVGPLEDDGGDRVVPTPGMLGDLRLLLAAPEMQAVLAERVFQHDGELVRAIAGRTGTDPERDLYPRLVAASVGATWQAATEIYLRADPPVPVVSVLREALALVAAGLPDPSGTASVRAPHAPLGRPSDTDDERNGS